MQACGTAHEVEQKVSRPLHLFQAEIPAGGSDRIGQDGRTRMSTGRRTYTLRQVSSRSRRNQQVARPYPALGLYPSLDALPEIDHPVEYPEPVDDYVTPVPTPGAFKDPARLSADQFVRWCRACDTVLLQTGQSPLCANCKRQHDVVLRKRRALAKRPDVAVNKQRLQELHELADAVRFNLADLSAAYAADKTDLARQVHVLNGNLGRLLHHLKTRIEDPRSPEERHH